MVPANGHFPGSAGILAGECLPTLIRRQGCRRSQKGQPFVGRLSSASIVKNETPYVVSCMLRGLTPTIARPTVGADMKRDNPAKHFILAFLIALVVYAFFYHWIEHRRTRKGPWEVAFTR